MMPKKTLTALKQSIAHWERHANGKARKKEEIYAQDCALCKIFYKRIDDQKICCAGCPVRQKTGKPICQGSPWMDARANWRLTMGEQSPAFHAAAMKMVNFLKSLLPKVKK